MKLLRSLNFVRSINYAKNYSNLAVNSRVLQETALNTEHCILVNEEDKVIGNSSKKDCHLVDKKGDIKLHRAFSVFLFNTNGDMLLQKRSKYKVKNSSLMNEFIQNDFLSFIPKLTR